MRMRLTPMAVFFHVWLTNNWREIFAEQYLGLVDSGLLDAAEITIGVIGEQSAVYELDTMCAAPKVTLVSFGGKASQFEFPTLERLQKYANEHEGCVCYLHTKGVSHPQVPLHVYWRNTMMDFVVMRWRECVAELHDGAAVAGVRWRSRKREWPHIFAGNFWWARCDYVRTLPEFDRSTRYGAEDWILSGHPATTFELRVSEPLI
jgi:hypothetical protein